MESFRRVACYAKVATANRFELWKISLPGSMLLSRNKEKFARGTGEHHLHIGFVYIPTKGSSFECLDNGVSSSEGPQQDIADVLASIGVALLAGPSTHAQAQPLTSVRKISVMFWTPPYSLT